MYMPEHMKFRLTSKYNLSECIRPSMSALTVPIQNVQWWSMCYQNVQVVRYLLPNMLSILVLVLKCGSSVERRVGRTEDLNSFDDSVLVL